MQNDSCRMQNDQMTRMEAQTRRVLVHPPTQQTQAALVKC